MFAFLEPYWADLGVGVGFNNCFQVYSCSWTIFIFYSSFNLDFWFWLNFGAVYTFWGLFLGCDNVEQNHKIAIPNPMALFLRSTFRVFLNKLAKQWEPATFFSSYIFSADRLTDLPIETQTRSLEKTKQILSTCGWARPDSASVGVGMTMILFHIKLSLTLSFLGLNVVFWGWHMVKKLWTVNYLYFQSFWLVLISILA